MALASSEELASWLRANADKRGTPDYQTVLRGFQEAVIAESRAAQTPPPAAPKPESGFLPALKAGTTELGGGISALMGKVGLKDEAKAESEYQAAKKRAAEIFKPTEAGWTEAPVTKFLELLGGSAPYMAAPLAAGAAAAALPLTGTAAAVAGLGAAGLTSAGQFTATNLSRQMEEGKKLADTELGSAALASVPMALLDTLSMRMIPGIGRIFGQAGVKITAENAKQIAEQGLKKTLADYAAKTGKTAGIEGATEAAQQVFERLQAGLNITDEKAREEYFDSFLGGAVLGGTLAPAGRYVERGREQREARGLLEGQAAAERKAARDAEEAKKKSPEYLQDLEARYQAAMQQKAQLDAAIVKPPKDADPATKIAYRDAVRARDEFAKTEMAEVAREYATRKKDIDALNQQRGQEAELAAQGIPQAEQKLPYYESAQGTIPGLEAVEPAEPAAPAEEAPDYAAQAQNLRNYLNEIRTRAKGTTDLDSKLQLGEEFERIQKALDEAETRAKEEGQGVGKKIESLRRKMVTAEEDGDINAQVDLAKQLKALGVTDLGAQAALDLGKPQALGKLQVPSDMADYQAAQQRAAEEKAAREAQQRQQQQLAKEAYERSLQTADLYSGVAAAAQRRAADRAAAEAETRAEAERTQREEEMVGKLVQATGAVQPQPVPQARMALPTGETTESLYDQATELRAQLSFAQQTRNKNLEARVRQQLQQIGASTEERGSALDLGATAREAGVEGELTPDAMEQNRLTRLAQRQLMSYDQLVKFITQAREREQTTVDEKTKAQYKYRAEQLKQAAIGFALQEINGRRQQYGLPVLEHKEAMRAVTGLARPLNELIARGAQIFEEPVVVRGQQRGIRLVEGAQEFERPPAGKRTFSEAGFPAAADTLREQFRKTVETVSGVPAAPAPAAFGKPPGPVRKVVPEQRELFLTPPPAEEPVSLAPTALLDKAADKAASSDDAQLLRQMQEVYTQLTPEQQSVVREQAQRAADGKPLDAVYEMRGLYQLQQREAATAAGQQSFLKPITLVTARRKIERLAQQAAALEKDLREKLQALIRTGVTRGIPELEQQLKDVGLKAASKVETKTPVEQAQAALDRALRQGKDLVAAAQKIKTDQFQEIAKFSSYVYTPLLEKQQQISREWDSAVAEFTEIQTQYDYFRAEFDAGRAPKANRAELAALTDLIPKTADRVVTVSKQLDNINTLVATAESTIASIRERQAADTVVGPLLKDAAKAKAKIDAAQKKLDEARVTAAAVERGHKLLMEAAAPETVTPLEQIEALPITGVTRVFRDTSDPAVQAQATKKRSAIAREEGTYAILEERLKTAEGDDKVSLQRQLNESEARLQKLHTELYDVYGNAPLKRVQGTTVEAAASAERLEKAQHAVHDAEIDAFNAKHDTARLSLPPRKAGPMISERGVVKQGGERVIKAEPATPIADIVSTRKRIDEINQQFAYLKDNPAKSAEGKAKQAKVKTQLAAERQTLAAKLKELLQSQREVVREEKAVEKELGGAKKVSKGAIRRSKLEATDAQLFEDLAKATKTKEQTLLFERAENAFGEMSAPEQAFVRRQANAVVGRREADYKGERLAEVVAAAERRMAREGEIELSRGATPNPSTTASVRTELKKAFPDLGRVQIFDTVDALIAANPQYEGRIPSDARGFVDTAGNKAFLIAENINQGQALSVLLHEVGAHIGLKNMLGTAQYNALVKAVETWAKKNDGSIESRVAKAAQARVEAAKTPASQKDDETLAYAIEEAVNAGVKPMETKGVLGQWMSQIATLFRKALEKFGLPPKALDAQGLVDLAFGAAKMEMRGQVAQVSRRQFLRGAGAALGAMKLPPLSKEMNLRALRSVFEASLDARVAWFDAIKSAVKGKGLGRVIDQYEDVYEGDNALINFTQSDELQDFLYNITYNENYQGDGYDYYLNEMLSGKDGLKVVADLQQALRAQGASLVDAAQKTAKEKGLPEVGELFFSGTEKPSAFKRWFGDSKVVDGQGKPLVVYHGTDKDFTTFDAEKPKTSGAMHGKGFYFADAATASSYSDAPSGGGLVMPVYLKMERPFIGKLTAKDIALLRKEMPEFDAAYKKFVAEEGTDEYTPSIERLGVLSGNRNEFIQKALRAAGYDGRIVTDEPSAPWTDPDTEYVVFEPTQIKSATGNRGTYDPTSPNILFSRNLPTAARVADNLIAKERGWVQNLKDNFLGMGFRAQFVDKLAPLEEALKKGGIDQTKALQAMYYLRMYDQRMHFTSQAISDGVPEIVEKARKDGGTERLIETKPGANISQIVDILKGKDVVKAAGSADAANRLFTLYLAAIRAERVGIDALNFGGKVTQADLNAARAEIEANPTLKNAFDEARDIYNQYNRNLIEFAVQTGALAKSEAQSLLASNDYIPYYRVKDGVAQLIVGKETPIRIGNLKDSPHLQELVGGDEAIFDFLTSSVQNTAMLLDMSMKNLATKNTMFELRDVGLATVSKVPKSGKTPEGAVTFKRDGEDYFAMVDTDKIGISGDLLVKGLAGIPTMFPSFVRVLGIPARFLRRVVVASPVYMARQLFRDSLAASMTSGADIVPVLDSLKQIGKPKALGARGITGGQVFTGMPEDVTRMLKDMQAGKVSVTSGLAWLEAKSAQVDALTREAQYQSYLDQGLSEMEATYMALESMNFSKRGLSPTLHMVSTLIPFFNAQIQGLDVLYKAFTKQMPMNERLAIRDKLWTRGMLLAGMSMAYALAMQDEESYKNAKPEEKYGNWFVPLESLGVKEPLRLPIPFELGYVFKALPEAIVNTLVNEKGGEEALKAGKHIVQQMIPGASSYFLPQAVKPALEALAFEKSLYTGRDIESAREKMSEPGFRYRDNTTELAREVGELTGFSPVKMEFLIRGYTGGMGMALLQALSAPFGSSGPEAATKRLSDLPVIGTLFQPTDASGIIDATYERMNKVNQVKETYEDLLNKGRTADAQKYISTRMDEMALASVAGSFKEYMGQITEFERGIRASNLTPDQKREKLDQARQMKIRLAESVRSIAGKTTPQSAPA